VCIRKQEVIVIGSKDKQCYELRMQKRLETLDEYGYDLMNSEEGL
jgi:hypothetical protein